MVDFTGLCMMTIPSRWVDLDHPIVTKITLRDYSSAVLSIHLLLIRTEYIHDVRALLCYMITYLHQAPVSVSVSVVGILVLR